MKVLWLVSITIPAAADACGLQAKEIGGGWLSGALGGMTAAPDAPAITVASVDARAETLTVCSKNGVSFALVPTGSVENFSALLKKIAPDLVHIWGTEYAAARTIQQAAQAAGIPVLVGIQGVMVDCALHLNDGVPARLLHSCAAQHLIDRHVPGGLLDVNQARFDTLAQSEAAVLANARHVTGRTSFDRSAVQKLAPQASYYPCNETLRPEFYTPPVWHPRTFGEAPVLLLSQGNYPLKNLHTVLKALPAVLAQYPGAVLRVAGWPPLDKGPLLRPVIDWMFPYQTWCKQLIRRLGHDPKDYKIADGCGLSNYNYLSPALLVDFLKYAYSQTEVFQMLYKSLPVGGVDGTLKFRMKGTPAFRNVHAKTGSFTAINALAGYLKMKNGHEVAFAIMNQNVLSAAKARAFQDKVCEVIIGK